MSDQMISALASASTLADGDLFVFVDISDVSMAPTGTNKRITKADLGTALGNGLTLTQYKQSVSNPTPAGTVTLDWSASNYFAWQMGQDETIAFSNAVVGQTIRVRIKQASSGGPYLLSAWPAGITWFGSIPAMPLTADGVLVVVFTCTGSGAYDGFPGGASAS